MLIEDELRAGIEESIFLRKAELLGLFESETALGLLAIQAQNGSAERRGTASRPRKP